METSKDGGGQPTISADQAFEKSMEVYNSNFRRKPAERGTPAPRERVRGEVPPLLSKPKAKASSGAVGDNAKIQQILAANPGKSPEWAAAYLKHLSQQAPR